MNKDISPGYPVHREVDVGLRDGSTVRVRPVRPDDFYDVAELFKRLSDDSRFKRFHGVHSPTGKELKRFVEIDYHDTFSLVAETSMGGEPRVVALASYISVGDGKADMAIVVDDPFHGRGVGSILIEHLSEAAAEAGIAYFEADIQAGNAGMLEVVRALELPLETDTSAGVVHAQFPTSPTPEAVEAFEAREAVSAATAVAAFLQPRSVAVIGASRRRGSISAELFHNLLQAGFEGPVYPVNPNASVVQSVKTYPSVSEIPGPVDLAIVAVPSPLVAAAANECAEKGVRALLVITSGFSEVGDEGVERQRELLEIARAHGMRIIGPNCMGIINTDPATKLNATFAPQGPAPGRLAFSSQSGALGIAVIDRALELGLGLSSFVSVGNKADISGNDLLQYWENDDATDVILLYLESFGNPRKFARVARRVARKKPIVAVKSGRSKSGARAAASHTGSIAAGDVAVDALFRQAGVIRTDTLEELFDVANLVAHQPLPAGERVAILTNAGGLGILCADACEAAGLEIPSLSDDTVAALREFLAAEASVSNPVDMIASASAEQYGKALRLIARDPGIDSVVVIFIPPLVTKAEDVAQALLDAVSDSAEKTVLACFLGTQGIHEHLRKGDLVVPTYTFPESAARALAAAVGYGRWRATPEGTSERPSGIDRPAAAHLVANALEVGERWLEPEPVSELLTLYGIRSARSKVVMEPEAVAAAATEIGGPVALKIVSAKIVHKSDVGGVRLDLQSPGDAAAAASEIVTTLEARGLAGDLDGFLVQEMVSAEGAEMFVGTTLDPSFGPLIACGAGGTLVELVRDVNVRITPLTDVDARAMLRSLKTWPLFEGYRGGPVLDAAALEDLLMRVSVMVEDLPSIAELDLNPVIVMEEGCVVLDARIRIAKPRPLRPRGARSAPVWG